MNYYSISIDKLSQLGFYIVDIASDGCEALEKLKEDGIDCLNAGMSSHTGKPFTWEAIYNTVEHDFGDRVPQLEKSSSQNV